MSKYSKYLNEAADLEGQDKRTADAVLTALENDVARDTYKRITQHISGKAPKQSHLEAKQQLLADILSLPCLQDEVTPEKTTIPSSENKRYRCADCADFDYCDHDVRDEFRTELRQALTAYFMGTVGGENGDSDSPELHEQHNVIKSVPLVPSKRED